MVSELQIAASWGFFLQILSGCRAVKVGFSLCGECLLSRIFASLFILFSMASPVNENPAPKPSKPVKKEEHKTVLSRIRSRVGLLVGIVFVVLLVFVLTD